MIRGGIMIESVFRLVIFGVSGVLKRQELREKEVQKRTATIMFAEFCTIELIEKIPILGCGCI